MLYLHPYDLCCFLQNSTFFAWDLLYLLKSIGFKNKIFHFTGKGIKFNGSGTLTLDFSK
jgi:hypothetical protein